jgi:hypothetical protein
MMTRDEMRREWLRRLEAEQARRAAKVAWEAAAGERVRERLIAQLVEMGQRHLATQPQTEALLVDELVAANGDRERVDEIRLKADMARAEAVAVILTKDPEAAEGLLQAYATEARCRGRACPVA